MRIPATNPQYQQCLSTSLRGIRINKCLKRNTVAVVEVAITPVYLLLLVLLLLL